LALAYHKQWQWYRTFLNHSNHAPGIPLDVVSFHFYASCDNRTNPNSYLQFFPQADDFIDEVDTIIAIRNELSPETRLDSDEMGVILPDDNNPNAPQFPRIYWNAAAALYAYLFGNLALKGVDVLGESQLVGYPQLGRLEHQFPSVALLNWTTGAGTARYWVLKLLIDNFGPGDILVDTHVAPTNPFCGEAVELSSVVLRCTSSVISAIDFASYGTPTGTCGSYALGKCHAANSSSIVSSLCVGKRECRIADTTEVFGDPCFGTHKWMFIQARCASGGGFASWGRRDYYAQAFVNKAGVRRVLLVNKVNSQIDITVPNANRGTAWFVDEQTGDGAPRKESLMSDSVRLTSWGVAVIVMP